MVENKTEEQLRLLTSIIEYLCGKSQCKIGKLPSKYKLTHKVLNNKLNKRKKHDYK